MGVVQHMGVTVVVIWLSSGNGALVTGLLQMEVELVGPTVYLLHHNIKLT